MGVGANQFIYFCEPDYGEIRGNIRASGGHRTQARLMRLSGGGALLYVQRRAVASARGVVVCPQSRTDRLRLDGRRKTDLKGGAALG